MTTNENKMNEEVQEVLKNRLEYEIAQGFTKLIRETERNEYYVSKTSDLYSLRKSTGKITKLKDADNGIGYRYVIINDNSELVHRLVAEAFDENFRADLQINHIDKDRANNDLSNLEVCTPKQNSEHRAVTKHFDEQIISIKNIKLIQRIKQTDSVNDVVNALRFSFNVHKTLELDEFIELEADDTEAIELINSFKNKKEA